MNTKHRLKLIPLILFLVVQSAFAQQWQAVKGKIMTPWAETVDPKSVLPEYPRPQMEREGWSNLNGLWEYAIRKKSEKAPASYDGQILVPFAVESALSGVGREVGTDNRLWYRLTISAQPAKGRRTLLHFGAVDWACEVYLNGKLAGTHEGGYDPFTMDITPFLSRGKSQELVVGVLDPTDGGPQPRGKQVREPHAIWYTPITGIWQTVWLETVPDTYIANTIHTVDFDNRKLHLATELKNSRAGDRVIVSVLDGSQKLSETSTPSGTPATIELKGLQTWSPSNPRLYGLEVSVVRGGKSVDRIKSYFAIRKVSMTKGADGIQRVMLNNEFVFQYGPLDQGWWPDGLYTAPTDEALRFDIEKTKEMGFNMIRKHVKVEPARWYYYCDKLGLLVWQDMPSGDNGNQWDSRPAITGIADDKIRTPESEQIFRKEWKSIIASLYNFPSIVMWVPFNEAWGQFKTPEIIDYTYSLDSTRLVNEASGGNFHYTGDVIDLHNYPAPAMPDPRIFGSRQAIVLGEFGGLGMPVEGHTWQQRDNWGYQSFASPEQLIEKYSAFINQLLALQEQGLSAAVYTQTTDVEIEINGLMTYDRRVIKIPVKTLWQLHQPLYRNPGGRNP